MIGVYILGTICGIAVLFLLKFMQVVSRELHGFGTTQEIFSARKINAHDSAGLLSRFRGRPDRALSVVTRMDRRFGESGAVLSGRTGSSIHGNPVFKEWARSWSKRTIIKDAIGMMSPAPEQIQKAILAAC